MAANRSSKKRPKILTVITTGPGKNAVLEVIKDMLHFMPDPLIPQFGNGYRSYPVRFTSVEIVVSNGELKLNIVGVLDFSESGHDEFSGSVVHIEGYSPYRRTAKKALVFD